MTNVPKIQITDSGLKLPTHQEILSGVLADINAAFGGGLNVGMIQSGHDRTVFICRILNGPVGCYWVLKFE